jgi:hypothetical protein
MTGARAEGRRRRWILGRTAASALIVLAAATVGSIEPAAGNAGGLRLAAAPSTAHTHPVPIDITTVPAVPGFPVTLDGVTHRADARGRVHFDAAPNGRPLVDRVSLTSADLVVDGQRVEAKATRAYRFKGNAQLALDVSYLVGFTFKDSNGPPVDASSFTTITVRSGSGKVAVLPAHEQSWLLGQRAVPKAAGLVTKNVDWTVQRVESGGSNVVNQSQQHFRPGKQLTVPVEVLFFGLTVQVDDGLYGFSLSDKVTLTYPDGSTRTFPLDAHGSMTVPALPRGNYTVTPLGSGLKLTHPLGISRDQRIDVQFYSWPDVASVLGVVLAIAGALAWVGRRRRRPSTPTEGAAGTTGTTDTSPVTPRSGSDDVPSGLAVATDRPPE